ncbi:Zinc finger C-x8-C-x5-C-x3-H type (and similar) [Pleodorina starrii]|nr:Zinc finger C-x8-C-x5-C-x3-H type (and similar) [Pleodorina starrii]
MAEAGAITPSSIELPTCSICLCEFGAGLKRPVDLGCGHCICGRCYASLNMTGPKTCPIDRTPWNNPHTAYELLHFVELLQKTRGDVTGTEDEAARTPEARRQGAQLRWQPPDPFRPAANAMLVLSDLWRALTWLPEHGEPEVSMGVQEALGHLVLLLPEWFHAVLRVTAPGLFLLVAYFWARYIAAIVLVLLPCVLALSACLEAGHRTWPLIAACAAAGLLGSAVSVPTLLALGVLQNMLSLLLVVLLVAGVHHSFVCRCSLARLMRRRWLIAATVFASLALRWLGLDPAARLGLYHAVLREAGVLGLVAERSVRRAAAAAAADPRPLLGLRTVAALLLRGVLTPALMLFTVTWLEDYRLSLYDGGPASLTTAQPGATIGLFAPNRYDLDWLLLRSFVFVGVLCCSGSVRLATTSNVALHGVFMLLRLVASNRHLLRLFREETAAGRAAATTAAGRAAATTAAGRAAATTAAGRAAAGAATRGATPSSQQRRALAAPRAPASNIGAFATLRQLPELREERNRASGSLPSARPRSQLSGEPLRIRPVVVRPEDLDQERAQVRQSDAPQATRPAEAAAASAVVGAASQLAAAAEAEARARTAAAQPAPGSPTEAAAVPAPDATAAAGAVSSPESVAAGKRPKGRASELEQPEQPEQPAPREDTTWSSAVEAAPPQACSACMHPEPSTAPAAQGPKPTQPHPVPPRPQPHSEQQPHPEQQPQEQQPQQPDEAVQPRQGSLVDWVAREEEQALRDLTAMRERMAQRVVESRHSAGSRPDSGSQSKSSDEVAAPPGDVPGPVATVERGLGSGSETGEGGGRHGVNDGSATAAAAAAAAAAGGATSAALGCGEQPESGALAEAAEPSDDEKGRGPEKTGASPGPDSPRETAEADACGGGGTDSAAATPASSGGEPSVAAEVEETAPATALPGARPLEEVGRPAAAVAAAAAEAATPSPEAQAAVPVPTGPASHASQADDERSAGNSGARPRSSSSSAGASTAAGGLDGARVGPSLSVVDSCTLSPGVTADSVPGPSSPLQYRFTTSPNGSSCGSTGDGSPAAAAAAAATAPSPEGDCDGAAAPRYEAGEPGPRTPAQVEMPGAAAERATAAASAGAEEASAGSASGTSSPPAESLTGRLPSHSPAGGALSASPPAAPAGSSTAAAAPPLLFSSASSSRGLIDLPAAAAAVAAVQAAAGAGAPAAVQFVGRPPPTGAGSGVPARTRAPGRGADSRTRGAPAAGPTASGGVGRFGGRGAAQAQAGAPGTTATAGASKAKATVRPAAAGSARPTGDDGSVVSETTPSSRSRLGAGAAGPESRSAGRGRGAPPGSSEAAAARAGVSASGVASPASGGSGGIGRFGGRGVESRSSPPSAAMSGAAQSSSLPSAPAHGNAWVRRVVVAPGSAQGTGTSTGTSGAAAAAATAAAIAAAARAASASASAAAAANGQGAAAAGNAAAARPQTVLVYLRGGLFDDVVWAFTALVVTLWALYMPPWAASMATVDRWMGPLAPSRLLGWASVLVACAVVVQLARLFQAGKLRRALRPCGAAGRTVDVEAYFCFNLGVAAAPLMVRLLEALWRPLGFAHLALVTNLELAARVILIHLQPVRYVGPLPLSSLPLLPLVGMALFQPSSMQPIPFWPCISGMSERRRGAPAAWTAAALGLDPALSEWLGLLLACARASLAGRRTGVPRHIGVKRRVAGMVARLARQLEERLETWAGAARRAAVDAGLGRGSVALLPAAMGGAAAVAAAVARRAAAVEARALAEDADDLDGPGPYLDLSALFTVAASEDADAARGRRGATQPDGQGGDGDGNGNGGSAGNGDGNGNGSGSSNGAADAEVWTITTSSDDDGDGDGSSDGDGDRGSSYNLALARATLRRRVYARRTAAQPAVE